MTNQHHIGAGIDLGSNTFRLLVTKSSGNRLGRVLTKKLAAVRLSRGLDDHGLLHEDSLQKGFAVLRAFREILDRYQPQSIRICGTEALRRAGNSALFLQQAEEILQHAIDIINGEEEARLSLAGTLAGFPEKNLCRPMLLVDVGGGSTELIVVESLERNLGIQSLPLGAVGLTERFLTGFPPDIAALDRLLVKTFDPACKKLGFPDTKRSVNIIGCGGTATSMAALDQKLTTYNELLVHGHVLPVAAIKELWDKLISMPIEKRNGLPCLGEGRGEILPAGIRIYLLLLKIWQQDQMRVSDTGLLEGILLSSLAAAAV